MTDFATQRRNDDAQLLLAYNMPRTREACRLAAEFYHGPTGEDVTTAAGRAFSKLFEAACRNWGATVCSACGHLTIDNEIVTRRIKGQALDICDDCHREIDKAVAGLPPWVKDRDLGTILPAFALAYVMTKNERR